MSSRKPPGFRCSVAWDIDADPSATNHQYSEYANPVLVLICRWLGTHSFQMKTFSSSKCDVKGYQVNFMWHSKELHLKFWQVTCFACVYEGILCSHFCERWLWPLGYLTLCHKLKKNIFLNRRHASKQTNKNGIIVCSGVLMLHVFLRFP